nr:MAG TPA: hypothetical protein [Bacteriophage sp.]
MTLTALCERFIDKNTYISVIEIKDDSSLETLFENEPVWHLEYSKLALYSVKYIDAYCASLKVYVTPPNDGYKKADY